MRAESREWCVKAGVRLLARPSCASLTCTCALERPRAARGAAPRREAVLLELVTRVWPHTACGAGRGRAEFKDRACHRTVDLSSRSAGTHLKPYALYEAHLTALPSAPHTNTAAHATPHTPRPHDTHTNATGTAGPDHSHASTQHNAQNATQVNTSAAEPRVHHHVQPSRTTSRTSRTEDTSVGLVTLMPRRQLGWHRDSSAWRTSYHCTLHGEPGVLRQARVNTTS